MTVKKCKNTRARTRSTGFTWKTPQFIAADHVLMRSVRLKFVHHAADAFKFKVQTAGVFAGFCEIARRIK